MALPSFGPRPPFSVTSGRNEKAANGGGLSILTAHQEIEWMNLMGNVA
jgi:hypothetical protein